MPGMTRARTDDGRGILTVCARCGFFANPPHRACAACGERRCPECGCGCAVYSEPLACMACGAGLSFEEMEFGRGFCFRCEHEIDEDPADAEW